MEPLQRWQFSMRRLFGTMTICSVLSMAPTSLGYHPEVGIFATAFSVCFGIFILLTGPIAWAGFGSLVAGTIAGWIAGSILYQSPLPGAVFGGPATLLVFIRVHKHEPNNRRRVLISSLVWLVIIGVFPYLALWRHHRAEYVIRKSGVIVSRRPQGNPTIGNIHLAEMLGPYIVSNRTSLVFRDSAFQRAGVVFDDNLLVRLKPHFDSVRGVDEIRLSSNQVTDRGLAQLANVTDLKRISLNSENFTSQGLQNFGNLTSIEELYLGCPQMDDGIFKQIEKSSKLRKLDLEETQVSDAAMTKIAKLPLLQQLWVPPSTSDETMAQLTKTIARVERNRVPAMIQNDGATDE